MPIFYTDNPLNVTASTGIAVTSTLTNPLTVTGLWSGSSIPVTSSISFPVWITGNISTGPSTTPDAYISGATYPSSGSLAMYVSGAANTTVFGRVGTGSNAVGALVTLADSGSVTASQGGAWSVQVSSTTGAPVYVATTGNLLTQAKQDGAWAVSTSGTTNATIVGATSIQVSGSWGGSVPVTSSVSTPVWVAVTGSVPVNTGTFPVVSVTQGSAWATSVSGNVGQAGAWAVLVSGTASSEKSANASLTTIEVGNASTVLLASNAGRRGATIFSVDATVFVAFGQTPTTSLYAAKVPSSSYYEIPYNWTGAVNAIAAASGQTVNIQEFTA